MDCIAAASGAFYAFGSISCMLILKRIWICRMEFALYKLIIIIIIILLTTETINWLNFLLLLRSHLSLLVQYQ